jgi:hypothetical protein
MGRDMTTGSVSDGRALLQSRAALGFALAPLPVLAPFLLLLATVMASEGSAWPYFLEAAPILVTISYMAALLVGLPTHLLLQWIGRTSLWAYLGLTETMIVLGYLAPTVLLHALQPAPGPNTNPHALSFILWSREGVMLLLWLAALALPCALLFWFVAVRPTRG